MSVTTDAAEVHPLVDLLGPTLIQDVKGEKIIQTVDAVKDKDLMLLYFSAAWCPPCQSFSPILKKFYEEAKNSLEIVYISSDKSVEEFQGYFDKMPWLSLPIEGSAPIKNKLAQTMQIQGIPALIVLDAKTGYFVTDQARNQVTKCMKSLPTSNNSIDKTVAVQTLIQTTWMEETKPVPLDQAKMEGGRSKGIMGIIMTLLKNPAAIFALLYFVKWFMRKYKELMVSNDSADETAAMTTEEPPSIVDDGQQEF